MFRLWSGEGYWAKVRRRKPEEFFDCGGLCLYPR